MWIDLHAHNPMPGMYDIDPHWGPSRTPEGYLKVGSWILGSKHPNAAPGEDPIAAMAQKFGSERRLQLMDKLGMDKMLVCVPAHMYMYWAEPEFGIKYSRIVNEELAQYCTDEPDRLYFWATAPMQDPAAAAAELERAVTQLGAQGLMVGGSNFGGLEAYSPELDVVWEKVCELDVPLFVHGYNQSVAWGDLANTDPYDTTTTLGMNFDEAKFFWYSINSGMLDRFPDLKIYITHGGGVVPFQLGRYNNTNKTMAPDAKNKKDVVEYLDQFWFDLELLDLPMRKAVVELIGVDHLVYGDNFSGADTADFDLTDGLGLSDADRDKIKGTNAIKLLKW